MPDPLDLDELERAFRRWIDPVTPIADLAHIQRYVDGMFRAHGRDILARARRLEVAETVLREIAEGAGPYSRDPLEHASNCIEAMKALALAALDAASERKEEPHA